MPTITRSYCARLSTTVLLLVSCRGTVAATHTHASTTPAGSAPDSAAYVVVLDSLLRRTALQPRGVGPQFLPLDRQRDSQGIRARLARELPSVTEAMWRQLETKPAPHETLESRLREVQGARWLDRAFFASLGPTPSPSYRIWLSRVAFSPDSAESVIYAVTYCGADCGTVELFLLQRDVPIGWRIHRVVPRYPN